MSVKQSPKHVVIFGGGIAGSALAKNLAKDAMIKVTLVDPNEYFEVPMAVPRILVKPDVANEAIIPFSQALPNMTVVRGALVELLAQQGVVKTNDDKILHISGDVMVLATGSHFVNPLMRSVGSSVFERKAFYNNYFKLIVAAQKILIVGGGPIGVEMAGELSECYPHKDLVLLNGGPRLLAGTSKAAAQYAAAVLAHRRVIIINNERLAHADSDMSEPFSQRGTATTSTGRKIDYDLIIWCTGGRANTGYMTANYASLLNEAGRIRVTPSLRIEGSDTIFALGDISNIDENKMAWHIDGQIKVAAANIRQVLAKKYHAEGMKKYKPQTGNPQMAVTLGSRMGVIHLPIIGVIRSSFFARIAKSEHMLIPKFRKKLRVS